MKDRQMAREEGAKYRFLTQPVKFLAGEDGHLAAVECIEMVLGEPDAKGRRRPVPVPDSNFSVACDTAILALGYWPDPISQTTPIWRLMIGARSPSPTKTCDSARRLPGDGHRAGYCRDGYGPGRKSGLATDEYPSSK
jgi:NADPH-dependent glutamate synthase beta subunit-like oxidoreductase